MTDSKTQAFLQVVDDSDCSSILDAIEDEAKTVRKLSEECDIPLSTAYRKIDRLQEADLIEEKVRLERGSKPKNVYEQSFDAAVIRVADGGTFEVEFVQPQSSDGPSSRTEAGPVTPVEGD